MAMSHHQMVLASVVLHVQAMGFHKRRGQVLSGAAACHLTKDVSLQMLSDTIPAVPIPCDSSFQHLIDETYMIVGLVFLQGLLPQRAASAAILHPARICAQQSLVCEQMHHNLNMVPSRELCFGL